MLPKEMTSALAPEVGPEKCQPVCAWYSLAMVTRPAAGMWPRLANQIKWKGIIHM